ncbi:hypothetical protein [Halolamina salifodinae]|uniref:Uncharacterized protein n=1 Tax=Halolamina salifodinae TaxID=1202767 RepID=A0A8T4GUW4_9EURY|nr:hypothetical protein [Halolamina salifodinae]MBP1986911.1 hypothetical protein [Halolamina salifodinae]
MRGPLHALFSTPLIGGYLRLRVAFLLAGILAVGSAAIAIEIGGVIGVVALLVPVMLALFALYVSSLLR